MDVSRWEVTIIRKIYTQIYKVNINTEGSAEKWWGKGGTGGKLKEENLGSLTDDQRHLMSEGAKAKGGWWT